MNTRKYETYPLVYLLVKLVLTIPIAFATIERSFSTIKYIKNELRNRMGDQWMNDYLVVYIEEDGLSDQKVETRSIMRSILSFEFFFTLHVMKKNFRDHK